MKTSNSEMFNSFVYIDRMITVAKRTGDFMAYRDLKKLTNDAFDGDPIAIQRFHEVAKTIKQLEINNE